MPPMLMPAQLDHLTAEELRQLVQGLTLHVTRQDQLISQKDQELHWRQSKIDKLTHELALHKRWRFGVKAEHWPVEQRHLFEETVDADIAAMESELEQLSTVATPTEKRQPKRAPLPPELPRIEIVHEPEFVRTIAVARITMPGSMVRLSAGRQEMSDELQALCFLAGANSIFYGDKLLTAGNPEADRDEALFSRLGLNAI